MKRPVLLVVGIAATIIATGCGRAEGAQRQPGEWETVSTIKSVDVQGVSPEVEARFRAQVGQSQTQRECLTAEQARNPLAEMRRLLLSNGQNCTFTEPVFADGRISLHVTCSPATGGTAQISVEGTFTETTLQADMTTTAQATAPAVTGMNMAAELRGRRLGDCPSGGSPM